MARQASTVPVRPCPPLQATSTRSWAARCHRSARACRAWTGSAGSHQSGHRNHRESQATGGGGLPCRYSPNWGSCPAGSPCLSPRPLTNQPSRGQAQDAGGRPVPRLHQINGSERAPAGWSGWRRSTRLAGFEAAGLLGVEGGGPAGLAVDHDFRGMSTSRSATRMDAWCLGCRWAVRTRMPGQAAGRQSRRWPRWRGLPLVAAGSS